MTLVSYEEYADSRDSILGRVPAHWNIQKLRTLLSQKNTKNRPDLPLLSVVREKGVIVRNVGDLNENHNFVPDDLSNYKVVLPGQFAMNKMKAWQGSYGVSKHLGLVSPAYFVFDLKGVEPDFFHLAIRSKKYVPFFTRASDGVRVGQWDLSLNRMREVPFVIPNRDEQVQIVRFLRAAENRIKRLIRNKRRLIGLLREQKQAIINQAVTRGIDPNVPHKPSGIPWLGDIPEHWALDRGKFYFREVDERSVTEEEELLSVSHITGVTPRSQKNIHMFKAESYIGSKICRPGQIAINTMWAWMAAVGVSKHFGVISPSYHTYEQLDERRFNDNFLDTMLRSTPFKSMYTVHSSGITSSRLRLYPEDFLNLRFPCPPLEEQEAIVEWLDKETQMTNTAITRSEREIELINEYRTRLISDVVTGKVDVRDVLIEDEELEDSEIDALDIVDDDEGMVTLDDEESTD